MIPKVFNLDIIKQRMDVWKKTGNIVVFTNGCFDILHPGHIHLFESCRTLGDRLIVGLNSDESIKKLKGKNRPINNFKSRATLLYPIRYIDAIVIIEDETPQKLIEFIRPNILAKGGDYKENEIVGYEFVKNYGGEIKIVPYLEEYSTTSLIQKIKNS